MTQNLPEDRPLSSITQQRHAIAAKAFFKKAFKQHGRPDKVTIDKSESNKSAIDSCNKGALQNNQIELRQIKYLNNRIE